MNNNKLSRLLLCLLLCVSVNTFSQLNLPRGSQMATVSQRIGITDVYVKYSRPSVNKREIWGKLVPYGMNNLGFGTAKKSPWRAGANENSIIKFTNNVKIEGKELKAGKYGFHIIVNKNNTATLIFNKSYNAWGSYFYNPKNDALRVDISTKTIPHQEQLMFAFNNVKANSAVLSLNWEKKSFPFKIEVDVTNVVLNDIKNKLEGQIGFNRQSWEQAAKFAMNNGGNLNEALQWVNGAISGQFYSQKTFGNVSLKSQILSKLGKKEEASKYLDEAANIANENQLNRLAYSMVNAKNMNKALKYFLLNVENNPKSANAHNSLGECYKMIGNKKKAIKHLKKALSLNPPANVKANSEKLLKELKA